MGAGIYSCLLDIVILLLLIGAAIWGVAHDEEIKGGAIAALFGGIYAGLQFLFKMGILSVLAAVAVAVAFLPLAIQRRAPALKTLLVFILIYLDLVLLLLARKFGYPENFIYHGWWPNAAGGR